MRNSAYGPFHRGAVILVVLTSPREKFWGVLLALGPAGVSLRGIELSSYEEAIHAVAAGETISASTLFLPMQRVERVELDVSSDSIPSLSQRFESRTGVSPATALMGEASDESSKGTGE